MLDEASAQLRKVALEALGKLGRAAQPAYARLAALATSEQPEIRAAAVAALGNLELDADTMRPHLSKALRDDNAEVRRAAVGAVGRLGPQGAILVPDIILLAEKRENLRRVERLLRSFERSGPDARSLPELIEELQHEHEAVRLLAVKFLGLAGSHAKDALPALERMRDDPSAEVRKQVETATEKIKNDSAAAK
jgi:HEAT repeat protein